MVLFVDGGLIVIKFYLVSGFYINKMSDYCVFCVY